MLPFAARWMDLEIIILSEVRQRQISYDITYMWNQKNDTNELIDKTETNSHRKPIYGSQRQKGGRAKLGVWD